MALFFLNLIKDLLIKWPRKKVGTSGPLISCYPKHLTIPPLGMDGAWGNGFFPTVNSQNVLKIDSKIRFSKMTYLITVPFLKKDSFR